MKVAVVDPIHAKSRMSQMAMYIAQCTTANSIEENPTVSGKSSHQGAFISVSLQTLQVSTIEYDHPLAVIYGYIG